MAGNFPELQTFYYLDHFHELLQFVEHHFGMVAEEGIAEFMSDFRVLDRDSQALYVRMANRRGEVFHCEKLAYQEVGNVSAVLEILQRARFSRAAAAADTAAVLAVLTRAELMNIVRRLPGGIRHTSGMKRGQLLAEVCRAAEPAWLEETGFLAGFHVQCRVRQLRLLQFLYFGNSRGGGQSFALRDLGVIRVRRSSSPATHQPRFRNVREAMDALFRDETIAKVEIATPSELLAMTEAAAKWFPQWISDPRQFGELVAALGMNLERIGSQSAALGVYRLSDQHPARERVVRICYASGDREEAAAMLEVILGDPASDEELLFAEDFHARKFGGRKLSRTTALLRAAPTLILDECWRDQVEMAVVQEFRANGARAFRTENRLWACLFGLLFWDELHTGEGARTPNEFDLRPTQLIDGSFATRNQAAINQKLAAVLSGNAEQIIRRNSATHTGTPNSIFQWRAGDEEMLLTFLATAPPGAIAEMLMRIVKNPGDELTGHPDLLVIDSRGLRLVEIKAEGDQIRRHQLVRMDSLRDAGFEVEVCRVKWAVQPEQVYVVIDVETTGGMAANHRMTEIGAVKMRGDQIVDRFTTLLNPERPIPRLITRLTGITDAMVADAPTFGQIADPLREFIGGSIFVAHNAAFDHAFIRAEYERLGQRFRGPTLCTVRMMRAWFPGQPSYKLSELCRTFEIPLTNAHRAMADAEATAALLAMLHRRRLEAGSCAAAT